MADCFQVFPIGMIKKRGKSVAIEIYDKYKEALLGLDQFSHILVLCWFHKNDTPKSRKVLTVHPRGIKTNPLTGVFATRSPLRPNLIGLFTCKILSIDENTVHLDQIDALDGSPVVDIKPYIPRIDSLADARVPGWTRK